MSSYHGSAEAIEIYWKDLNPEKQAEIFAALGGNGNYDVFPIAVIPIKGNAHSDENV